MDHLGGSTSLPELWLLSQPIYAYISTNIALILIATIVIASLKVMVAILEPMNYELDMTAKEYCKSLAEIDNSLRFKRGLNGELHSNDSNLSEHQRALSCTTTDQLNGSELRSLDKNNESSSSSSGSNSNSTHTGSANHVYPNGWIPIMESWRVRSSSVKKAIIFGRDVIITRSADGEVGVLDAYCPHMGVHIGIGGRVKQVDNQSCVECPFHGWTFRSSDGQCVKIPYQKNGSKLCSIPKQAKLNTWLCTEVDNFIYVWHHIDDQSPSWFLTPSNELQLDKWQLAGRSCHKTNLELRDMHENGADMNHFEGIHNDLFILGGHLTKLQPLNYLQDYTRHHWIPEWKPILDEVGKRTHMAQMKLQSWISLFKLRLFDITVRAIQLGPARVNLYYNSKWYGKGLLIMNAIPMGGRRTKYIQHIYTQRTLFQCFMAKWVLYGEIKMLERDFFIWNHKKNIRNPVFVPEDKTLKQFRSWYNQFYTRKRKIVIQSSDSGSNSDEGAVMTCKDSLDF